MQYACMAVNITIREVPDEVRDELAARAALEGKSMQEYLRSELERIAARPSIQAWLANVKERKSVGNTRIPPSKIIRARNADRK